MVDICAVIVALAALCVAFLDHCITRKHNRRSVRPLPFVSPWDFEDRLRVILRNDGTGPLIVRSVTAKNPLVPAATAEKPASPETAEEPALSKGEAPVADTKPANRSLIDAVPNPPSGIHFTNYCTIGDPRAILPGKYLDLLDIKFDLRNPVAVRYRDQLRDELGAITVHVDFTDIYGQDFLPYMKKLTWFRRVPTK